GAVTARSDGGALGGGGGGSGFGWGRGCGSATGSGGGSGNGSGAGGACGCTRTGASVTSTPMTDGIEIIIGSGTGSTVRISHHSGVACAAHTSSSGPSRAGCRAARASNRAAINHAPSRPHRKFVPQ